MNKVKRFEMPCYGGSCCDFCGLEIGVSNCRIECPYGNKSSRFIMGDSIFFIWLRTSELICEKGKIHDNLRSNLTFEMEDINDNYQRYTNCKFWNIQKTQKKQNLKEGVFLHAFCRIFIEKRTNWDRKTIFQVLRKQRQPYVVNDNQVNLFSAMEFEKVPIWRAVNPRYNQENRDFFSERIQQLILSRTQ